MIVICLSIVDKVLSLKQKILKLYHTHYVSQIFQKTSVQQMQQDYMDVYDFSVDYRAITSDKIHNIHAYLMKKNKNNIV